MGPGHRTPQRGDVYIVDADPVSGHEQEGERRWLVLSPGGLNRYGVSIAVAITTGGYGPELAGLTVDVRGQTTNGVAIIHQVRSLDIIRRNGKFIESLPAAIVDEVGKRVASLIDPLDSAGDEGVRP